ncbi:MAG: teichuronic acid biosynthesis glycosyltransferase TuaC [Sphingomonadales bacterium]|jgi:glycosyltransferase involved in cell wall biosynthesis|nr:teichuronic acid biosynthesis glycosyltransferase TuaC [Sphingomonadales bacterium]
MLRVLVLTSRFPDRLRPNLGNFVERQTLELAARPGIEVEVIAPIGRAPFPFSLAGSGMLDGLPEEEMWKTLPVHRPRFAALPYFPRLRPGALARRLLPLARSIRRRFPFDIVSAEFSWPDGPAAVALGRALGVAVVIKARGMEFEGRARSASIRRQLVAAGEAAQGLLAVSESVKRAMVSAGLPGERIAVHRPAVDSKLFRPGDREAAKARLGISGPLLLAVGNLIPQKGHRLAIEALALLEGATLIVAGAGPERRSLLARARDLGVSERLRLTGSVPHDLLPSIYAAADVTVHPSRVEGFGNVRLESLACGTPLVTTSVGDGALIVDRPAAGRIVEADPEAIAAAVRALLADPPQPGEVRAAILGYGWGVQAEALELHLRAAIAARSAAARSPGR